jgi:hypothetical protein
MSTYPQLIDGVVEAHTRFARRLAAELLAEADGIEAEVSP